MNGIILVNKESGQSSNKVVNKVKYLLKANKAGHLGTLDVLGEGLLPVTINKGTKVFDYFLTKDKEYKTIFQFGITTDTLDLEGEITKKNNIVITLEMLNKVLPKFIGKQLQMPPVYSAKKIGGKTAYRLAREGKEVSLNPKEIEIYNISCLRQLGENTFELIVHCSSGTYIRSLARDIAEVLGTYGVMRYIQRTKCGIFDIKDAFSLKDIEKGNYKLISLDKLFDNPKLFLNGTETNFLLNGMTIPNQPSGIFKVYSYDKQFLGLGSSNDGNLKLTLRLC